MKFLWNIESRLCPFYNIVGKYYCQLKVKDETTIGNNGQIYPAPKFVSTFHSVSESSFNQDDLTDAWDELLDYPDD